MGTVRSFLGAVAVLSPGMGRDTYEDEVEKWVRVVAQRAKGIDSQGAGDEEARRGAGPAAFR